MKRIIVLLLFSSTTIFFGCSKKYLPHNYPKESITFGSGGGFTGAYTNYILLSNGQLFKQTTLDNQLMEAKKRISNNETRQFFKNYKTLNIGEMNYQNPGNMTSFIEYQQAQTKRRVAWSTANSDIPKNAKLFYSLLNTLVKKSNFEKISTD